MASPFDFTKDIMNGKSYILTEENEGEYVPWIANRVLSNYPDCIFYAQDMNSNAHLSRKMQHDYLFHTVRKQYRKFIPYPKAKETEHINLIMSVYKYSAKKAREALAILTIDQIKEIEKIYTKGG